MKMKKVKRIGGFVGTGRVLDIGCGDGELLVQFKKVGWRCYGVEPFQDAYEKAHAMLGEQIYNAELSDCRFPDSYFDCVVLNHVLEHVYDLHETMREVTRILAPWGILYICVPNAGGKQLRVFGLDSAGLDLPRHVYHFSPETLARLLGQYGYNTISLAFPLFYDWVSSLWLSISNSLIRKRVLTSLLLGAPIFLVSLTLLVLDASWRGSIELLACQGVKPNGLPK